MPAYDSFIIVALIAFAAPVLRALAPWLLVPSIVLEILLGVLIGPHALDWAQVDAPVQVFADVGLAMLLFMAGLENDLGRLPGRNLTLSLRGSAICCGLRLPVGGLASAAGPSQPPLPIPFLVRAGSPRVLVVRRQDCWRAPRSASSSRSSSSSAACTSTSTPSPRRRPPRCASPPSCWPSSSCAGSRRCSTAASSAAGPRSPRACCRPRR